MTPTTFRLTLAACLLSACPADDASPVEAGSTDSTTSTTGPEPTTSLADTTTTTADPTTSTTAVDSTSISTDSSSTSSDPSTGDPPLEGNYGDCINGGQSVCEFSENCLVRGAFGVCASPGCDEASDCPANPIVGAPPVVCSDVTGDGVGDCVMECATWEDCPDTMLCVNLGTRICMWPIDPPGGGACPDVDLGSRVPQTYIGDTTGLVDDFVPPCSLGGGEDASLHWTAPTDGTYVFDTNGSGDTTLSVLTDCPGVGTVLDCNDDFAMVGGPSQATIDLVAGQSVVIVVDGWDSSIGPFTLNIQ